MKGIENCMRLLGDDESVVITDLDKIVEWRPIFTLSHHGMGTPAFHCNELWVQEEKDGTHSVVLEAVVYR